MTVGAERLHYSKGEVMGVQSKILIVDDNLINIEVLQENLAEDYPLEVAVSGQEALDKAAVFKPSIILLDIMMPEMDGYEVCRKIRSIPGLHFTKIIMLSAKTADSERIEGYEAGADDYIVKPFNKDELRAKIQVYSKLKSEEEMNEMKNDLLLLLSHETNTPLNSIKGFSDLLLQTTELDEKQKEFVTTIIKAGNDLEAFIKKALMLSGLKNDSFRMEMFPEPLSGLVDNVVNRLNSFSQERNVSIDILNNTQENVIIQKDLIESALKSVVENAVKFSPEGEKVLVQTESNNGHGFIKVKDRGEGIKGRDIESIFDLFSIQDMRHHQKGQGLSLAVARNILERHNGSLEAENNEEGGATFTFKLPAQ